MFGGFYFGQPFFAQGVSFTSTNVSISVSQTIIYNVLSPISAAGGRQIKYDIHQLISDSGTIVFNVNIATGVVSTLAAIAYNVLSPISASGGSHILFNTFVSIISSANILYNVLSPISALSGNIIIFNVSDAIPRSAQIIFDIGTTFPPVPILKEIRFDVLNKKPYILTVIVSGSPCPLSTISYVLSG